MKKIITITTLIILLSILIIPLNVYAANVNLSNCTAEDLATTLPLITNPNGDTISSTDYDLTQYNTANSNKVNIYIFRGDQCQNCYNLYKYYFTNAGSNVGLKNLITKYGNKINIVTYETRNNAINNNLMYSVANLLGENISIYPYVVIGNKTFNGDLVVNDGAQKQAQMEAAIDALYASNNRYDVLEELTTKRTFVDANNNITLISSKGLDPNYVFTATKVDSSNLKDTEGYDYIDAYDITMVNGATNIGVGTYTIRIPVLKKYDTYKIKYVNDAGVVAEEYPATYKNGYVEFTTTHLSEYVVYGKNNPITQTVDQTKDTSSEQSQKNAKVVKNGINNPQTLDNIEMYVALLGLGCVSLIGSCIFIKRH